VKSAEGETSKNFLITTASDNAKGRPIRFCIALDI
jgi:hypothetical protein